MSKYSTELAVVLVREVFGATNAVSSLCRIKNTIPLTLFVGHRPDFDEKRKSTATRDLSLSTPTRKSCLGVLDRARSTSTRPLGHG